MTFCFLKSEIVSFHCLLFFSASVLCAWSLPGSEDGKKGAWVFLENGVPPVFILFLLYTTRPFVGGFFPSSY